MKKGPIGGHALLGSCLTGGHVLPLVVIIYTHSEYTLKIVEFSFFFFVVEKN